MVQQAVVVVETKSNEPTTLRPATSFFSVAEAADHAVCASVLFNLLHAFPRAGLIRKVQTLRDYAVAASAGGGQPACASFDLRLAGESRKSDALAN